MKTVYWSKKVLIGYNFVLINNNWRSLQCNTFYAALITYRLIFKTTTKNKNKDIHSRPRLNRMNLTQRIRDKQKFLYVGCWTHHFQLFGIKWWCCNLNYFGLLSHLRKSNKSYINLYNIFNITIFQSPWHLSKVLPFSLNFVKNRTGFNVDQHGGGIWTQHRIMLLFQHTSRLQQWAGRNIWLWELRLLAVGQSLKLNTF